MPLRLIASALALLGGTYISTILFIIIVGLVWFFSTGYKEAAKMADDKFPNVKLGQIEQVSLSITSFSGLYMQSSFLCRCNELVNALLS